MIPAHDSPLAALAFDASGTKLATASEKVSSYSTAHWPVCNPLQVSSPFVILSLPSQGTVIRVFSIPEGQKLFEFRRGVKR